MNYRWWGSTWGLILWVAWVVAASVIENLCLKDFGFRNEDWDWQYTTYTAQIMQLQPLGNKVHLQLIDVMCFNWMWSKQYFNRDICQKNTCFGSFFINNWVLLSSCQSSAVSSVMKIHTTYSWYYIDIYYLSELQNIHNNDSILHGYIVHI